MTEEFDLFTSERLLSTHSSLMDFIMTCKKKKKTRRKISIYYNVTKIVHC